MKPGSFWTAKDDQLVGLNKKVTKSVYPVDGIQLGSWAGRLAAWESNTRYCLQYFGYCLPSSYCCGFRTGFILYAHTAPASNKWLMQGEIHPWTTAIQLECPRLVDLHLDNMSAKAGLSLWATPFVNLVLIQMDWWEFDIRANSFEPWNLDLDLSRFRKQVVRFTFWYKLVFKYKLLRLELWYFQAARVQCFLTRLF